MLLRFGGHRHALPDALPQGERPARLSIAPAVHVTVPLLRRSIVATKEEIVAFIAAELPQTKCVVQEVGNAASTVTHAVGLAELRPGGTVAGPVLMTVADVALYVAILGEIGIVPLAVTTSMSINFMRKPAADRSIVGACKLLKLGRSLAVGEVTLYSEGRGEPVAHAVGTYAIPPARRGTAA
jgi:acyl-coenzyme A thioesterase PaaI-like protein